MKQRIFREIAILLVFVVAMFVVMYFLTHYYWEITPDGWKILPLP